MYRRVADRVALLLVVDRTKASGMLDWPRGDMFLTAHGFDAVFLYVHTLRAIQLA